MNYVVTGGSGFIGSNFLNLMVPNHKDIHFFNADALTYAANNDNIKVGDHRNYTFIQLDISDKDEVNNLFSKVRPDVIINFAAESHVDQSIKNPEKFIYSNIIGTFNLLQAAFTSWDTFEQKRFHHISTDEVFGSLGTHGAFTEQTQYSPNSPYSASKASSDHLVRAYNKTFGLPTSISNCSNNYGKYQHDEKLIPTIVRKALSGEPIPVYGNGMNFRDWLFVEDHCEAIWQIVHSSQCLGETYNIGGSKDISNLNLIESVLDILSAKTSVSLDYYKSLITFVEDRKGHDFRYAIDYSKIDRVLGWKPKSTLSDGLSNTIDYYLEKYSK